ncbi:hypothetical protein [Sphingomonas sp. R86521]|uniref:hypothetical protein n=1 Tax=Sphingomonas sp. R86521 TaxID=3093860 RepID=UPI0036D25F7D
MRIAIIISLAVLTDLSACSRKPAKPADVTAVAATRAKANIDAYAAAKAKKVRPVPKPLQP